MPVSRTPQPWGGIALLLLAIAGGARAQDTTPSVDRLLQDANDRVARGESPDAVEKMLRERLRGEPPKPESAPPSWDVYARADWERRKGPGDEAPQAAVGPSRGGPPPILLGMKQDSR
jgi:hypothetical protein